jgi:hypothetical protein
MVAARIGDADAAVQRRLHASESDAQAYVDELIATGGDGWREITVRRN